MNLYDFTLRPRYEPTSDFDDFFVGDDATDMHQVCCIDNSDTDTQANIWANVKSKKVR
jgi:hypothetical protein